MAGWQRHNTKFATPPASYRTPELEFPKTAAETAGETAGETRGAGGTAAGTAAVTSFLCSSEEGQSCRQSPQQFPQHPEFSWRFSQQSPQQFWGIPARGSCSWPGESQY